MSAGIETLRRWVEAARKTDTSDADAARSLRQALDSMSAGDFADFAEAVVAIAGPVLAEEVDDTDDAVTDIRATIAAQFVILQAFAAEDAIADVLPAINTADAAIGTDSTDLDTARDALVAAAALVPLVEEDD